MKWQLSDSKLTFYYNSSTTSQRNRHVIKKIISCSTKKDSDNIFINLRNLRSKVQKVKLFLLHDIFTVIYLPFDIEGSSSYQNKDDFMLHKIFVEISQISSFPKRLRTNFNNSSSFLMF